MLESMTILILFAIYTVVSVGVASLIPVKCHVFGQFVSVVLASVTSYAVVNFFNEQRAAWKNSGIGPMPDHLMHNDDIRLYTAFGVFIIICIGYVHLNILSEKDIARTWEPIIYAIGIMTIATILTVFPTARRDVSKESKNIHPSESTVATQADSVLETVIYDGQSNTDVFYLRRDGERPWASVSEQTTVREVEWSKQWRATQDGQMVTINHTPTLSISPKLRLDKDGINSDAFTSWLADTNAPIRITRVVKQHITDSSKTLPRDIIVVYYEPINEQAYQQYKATLELYAKVNPEKHTK